MGLDPGTRLGPYEIQEPLTGHRALFGKSNLSAASAILEKEPNPILQPLTPPGLDHAIRRCLAKDPEQRWQTARDLQLELKWIGESGSQSGITIPATPLASVALLSCFIEPEKTSLRGIAEVGAWKGIREKISQSSKPPACAELFLLGHLR